MIEVGEQSVPVSSKRLCETDDVFEAGCQSACDPATEELLGGLSIGGPPEPAQVFLQEIALEQRSIEVLEFFEVSQGRMIEPLSALEQKKTGPPGACITPSSVIIVMTIIFLIISSFLI